MLKTELMTFELLDKKDVMDRIMNNELSDIYFIDDKQNHYTMIVPDSYKPIKMIENIDFDFVKNHDFLLRLIIDKD